MVDAVQGMTRLETIQYGAFPLGYKSAMITGDVKNQLVQIYDEGLIEICGAYDWRFLRTSATISITTATYNFVSNSIYVDQIDSIFVTTTGKSGRIFPGNWDDFKNEDPEFTATGRPNRYAEWGNGIIVFDTTPDQTYSGIVLYKQIPQMVTDDSSYSIIPRKYQFVHRDYISWKFSEEKGDKRNQFFKTKYEESIQKALIIEQNKIDSGDYFSNGSEPTAARLTMSDYMRAWLG